MTKATVNKLNGLTPARKAALPSLRAYAFAHGVARSTLTKALFALCGATPNAELFDAASRAIRVGGMASALANKGDNRDQLVLFAYCETAITARQAKTAKMNETDEAAYSSAKAKLSTLCRDAGVLNPSLNAKPVKTRAPGGKPAKAAKTAPKAPVAKVPTITNDNDLRSYVAIQRSAVLAVMAKASQCKGILNETSSAIQEAMTILAKIAPTA